MYSRIYIHQLLGNKFAIYNYCMYRYSWNHIVPENMLKIIHIYYRKNEYYW